MNKISLIASVIFLSLFFYQNYIIDNMKKDLKEMTKQNTIITEHLNSSQESLKKIDKQFNNFKEEVIYINNEFDKIRIEQKEFTNKIKNHDLTKLINSKPIMMQNIINNGTEKVLKELSEDPFKKYRENKEDKK